MPAGAVRTLLDDLVFTEGPRWHDGRLWCSDMHDHRVISTALDGHADTVVRVEDDEPSGLGWLPDGRLLVVAMETQRLLRVEPDGELAVHADLSSAARGSLNDMIVAADGTAYIGDMGVRIHELGAERRAGQTFRVAPDGTWECAADDLRSPNGHILTDDGRTLIVAESGGGCLTAFTVRTDGTLTDRRTFAELTPERDDVLFAPPDGICLDADGAVWVADPLGARVFRVREGGEVTDTIRFTDVIPVACVLGGPGRRTLLMCVAADWKRDALVGTRSGRIVAADVDVPGAGRP
ncbi:MAG TPA: SMP-30/gluconolactonase/LRE family protein [Acidimicrobiia bacterium]|jgi:sugar lactone lactonase YvrE|nr:SMP-30/gluconolactonase/LRE family protein [Acidimicrobiia bacterium]